MASELRVNTLKDASGNNSVATSTVAQGSAKAWAAYGSSGTTFQDSFNFSSATDNDSGDYTFTYTNAFSNNDAPSTVGFQSHTSGTQASIPSWQSRNSTTIRVNCFDDVKNANGIVDAAATVHTMGDLA